MTASAAQRALLCCSRTNCPLGIWLECLPVSYAGEVMLLGREFEPLPAAKRARKIRVALQRTPAVGLILETAATSNPSDSRTREVHPHGGFGHGKCLPRASWQGAEFALGRACLDGCRTPGHLSRSFVRSQAIFSAVVSLICFTGIVVRVLATPTMRVRICVRKR